MAHIQEQIDSTVAIFLVTGGRIFLIHHCQLDKWLPLGGHIELDEDPEQTALREAREESGLEAELIGKRKWYCEAAITGVSRLDEGSEPDSGKG